MRCEIVLATFTNANQYFIQHSDETIELFEVIPAPPCKPFSTFCLVVPQCRDDIKTALQFLSDGMRGYYALLADDAVAFSVHAGDTLYVK